MRVLRSRLLAVCGVSCGLALVFATFAASPLLAQDYPSKPVKIIVPYPPAGTTDILARLVAARLTESLKSQFIVENKAGAGGNIGNEAVARSAPDGYTLVMSTAGNMTVNPATYASMPVDVIKDFAPITMVAQVSNVMAVHPSVPAKTVPEFIAWVKSKPKQVFFASSSPANTPHMSGELFNIAAGLDMTAVHYKGSGPALQDLVAGQGVQVMFDNMPSVIAHIQSGALRGLAVTASRRSPTMPDLPTVDEAGLKGYAVVSWFALFAPAKTPKAVIEKLYMEIVATMSRPDMAKKLVELGAEAVLNTPDELGRRVASEIEMWRDVAKKANIRIE